MLNMLIVDDEKIIREGIKNCVDWESHNINIVDTAKNGKIALELCEKHQPDIVITDIKMPYLDGLSFLETINEQGYNIKVIVLSGYDNFEYAQRALKSNVVEYILKPIKANVLKEVVLRVAEEIENEIKQKAAQDKLWIKIEESMPAIKQHFFRDLAEGYTFTDKMLLEKLQFLKLPYDIKGTFGVMILSIDGYEKITETLPEHSRQIIHYTVLEELQIHPHIGVWADFIGQYGILTSLSDNGGEELYKLALQLKENIQNTYNLSVSVGVGNVYTSLSNTKYAWYEAKMALEYRLILGQGQIINFSETNEPLISKKHYDLKFEENIIFAFKNLDKEQLLTAIDDYLKFCVESVPLQYVKSMFIKLLFSSIMSITEIGENPAKCVDNLLDVCAMIENSSDVLEIKNILYSTLLMVIDNIEGRRQSGEGQVVKSVIKYINENYNQNFSLKKISENLYLSPNYICTLFKKNVGKTIGDYLIETRIKKAKELLKDPKYKVYNIANMVGYTDINYFSNLFKKHTGMNVTEYKNYRGE